MKSALGGVAANLRLEMRRVFERELPAPDTGPNAQALALAARAATATLRPALRNAVLLLGKTLGERLDAIGVFSDSDAQRSLSERLRRDIWMFSQVVRAFSMKARAAERLPMRIEGGSESPPARASEAPGSAAWNPASRTASPLAFVREFLAYFRAMGVPLLRAADYPRVDAFLRSDGRARRDRPARPAAISRRPPRNATSFQAFLLELFERIRSSATSSPAYPSTGAPPRRSAAPLPRLG